MAIIFALKMSNKLNQNRECKYVSLLHPIYTSIFIYRGISSSSGLRVYRINSFFIAPNN